MGNPSSSSGQISLPQGGGALSGIGEKFSPDLHTGTGNFTLPIEIPAGRNDFKPDINLVYSTGNGNGPFGLGWKLDVPGIKRKTSRGIPRYNDEEDVFVLSGTEDLIPVEHVSAATVYRPRSEGLFARITHNRDERDFWTVESRDGLVSIYGTEEKPAESGDGRENPAIITDPADRRKIFSWNMTETRDPFGNRILYDYAEDDDSSINSRSRNQIYLQRIRYANYQDQNDDEQFLVSVEFEYETLPERYDADSTPARQRIYPFSDYRAGFGIRTRKRCKRIRIKTHPGENGERQAKLVRTCEFTYLDERAARGEFPQEVLPHNGASLLSLFEIIGHNGTEKLPPLEFFWSQFHPGSRTFSPVQGSELPARSLNDPNLELVDLFGNGLPDLLETRGTMRCWRNLGEGRFDLPREIPEAPAGMNLDNRGVQIIDSNGNGRADLLVTRDTLSGYYPSQHDGTWDRRSFQRYPTAPSFNLDDPEVQLTDLNGNGVTDAIRSGARLECYFNDPHEGWHSTRRIERRALSEFPDVNFSDQRVRWADMSGDGLRDIVLLHDGHVEYWPSHGHGSWGRRISMQNSPRFPDGYDPGRILIDDVDGDGLADIIYVDNRQVTLWINQAGNGWSDPVTIQGTPPVNDMDSVRLTDLLGTGISGILWSSEASGHAGGNMFYLDFTGGVKPYLLNEVDNHMGSVTRVEYAPSTRFYLEDTKRPETRWVSTLPFPVQVIARIEVIDKISGGKLATEFSYHHGYWDGAEREFRGFGRVDQRDTETFDRYHESGLHQDLLFEPVEDPMFSPPTETRTWFHQGAVEDKSGDWTETDYSHEYWPGDPQLLDHRSQVSDSLRAIHTRSDGTDERNAHHRARRDALRTLRGNILRTELYGLDDSPLQERPYTVTEHTYNIREESEPDGSDVKRERIFFPHRQARRTTRWERGNDPMTQFSFTGTFDDFGRPHRQTVVNMPRREAKRQKVTGAVIGDINGDIVNETRVLATHTLTEYATPDPGIYIHDRVAQERTYELEEPPVVRESDAGDIKQVLRDQAGLARNVHEQFSGTRTGSRIRLTGHTLNHYDGEAFTGRKAGEAGKFGALVRSESLVFSGMELNDAYGERLPAYLGGNSPPPEGAPEDFGFNHGYRKKKNSGDYHSGWYADTRRQRFDFQEAGHAEAYGIVTAIQDPLGHQTTIETGQYRLLPVLITDSAGLETEVVNDYRVMQPARMTDPNGNSTHFRYTPLGLVDRQFLTNRKGDGGSAEKPEVEYAYNFHAFEKSRDGPVPQPVFVHTRQRIRHASDGAGDETIGTREYSDGFGRLIQTRAQAGELVFGETGHEVGLSSEPGTSTGPAEGRRITDSVMVSGWQVYDNKGEIIKKYEPFFAEGWSYQPADKVKKGRYASLFYDPGGRLIRTVNPDGSEQRDIPGIPDDLEKPSGFDPTPWETYSYDPNDLAPASRNPDRPEETLADRAPGFHHFTPASTLLDGLDRVICKIERNGPVPETDWHVTRSAYDVRGNLLTVTDALGRNSFEYAYDLLDNELKSRSSEAGLRTSVYDAAGNLIEYRDSKGSIVMKEYDVLGRLLLMRARDSDDDPVTLREQLVYGDDESGSGIDRGTAGQNNLLGRLFRHFDEAGLIEYGHYDQKGNPEEKTRNVISDEALEDGWTANWDRENALDDLDSFEYRTSTNYDALDRPLEIICPADPESSRATIEIRYNSAGDLEHVKLDGDTYVSHIAYNPNRQRVLIVYGSNIMTRRVYNPATFRLERLRTEKIEDTSPDVFTGKGNPLQDFTYTYDLAGNITAIEDRTPNSGIVNSSRGRNRLLRQFSYDPLYRLTGATGRACKNNNLSGAIAGSIQCGMYKAPYQGDSPAPNQQNAPELTAAYTENCEYDPAGNLLKLRRSVGENVRNRQFTVDPASNRLVSVTHGSAIHQLRYDASGNLTGENTERHYSWNHADRLKTFRNQPGDTSGASVEGRYLYDSEGIRIKKYVRKNGHGNGESTVYIGGVFESASWHEDGDRKENSHLYLMDGHQRIAQLRRGPAHPGDAGPPVQYHLGDHTGNSHVVADSRGIWINREEYFPYGETSFGSYARKRYRFTGRERDEESGLNYHEARYYSLWTARWISCDPAGPADGYNLYCYARDNPLSGIDPEGTQTWVGIDMDRMQTGVEETDEDSGDPVRRWPAGQNPALQFEQCVEPVVAAPPPREDPFPNIRRERPDEYSSAMRAKELYDRAAEDPFQKEFQALRSVARRPPSFNESDEISLPDNFLDVLSGSIEGKITGDLKGMAARRITPRLSTPLGTIENAFSFAQDLNNERLYNMADRSQDERRSRRALQAAIGILAADKASQSTNTRKQYYDTIYERYHRFEEIKETYSDYQLLERRLDPGPDQNRARPKDFRSYPYRPR